VSAPAAACPKAAAAAPHQAAKQPSSSHPPCSRSQPHTAALAFTAGALAVHSQQQPEHLNAQLACHSHSSTLPSLCWPMVPKSVSPCCCMSLQELLLQHRIKQQHTTVAWRAQACYHAAIAA
jgi:hypothetical protein